MVLDTKRNEEDIAGFEIMCIYYLYSFLKTIWGWIMTFTFFFYFENMTFNMAE